MLKTIKSMHKKPSAQHGVAAVEFAMIAILLFLILFGIFEFGRLFYVYNTVQEVTRRAAREAVVRWVDTASQNTVKSLALLGGINLPAGAEITAANINIDYLNALKVVIDPSNLPSSPADNISACLSSASNCIAFVEVSIVRAPAGVTCDTPPNPNIHACYEPMVGLLPLRSLLVPIPASTVTMPAESMGYRI